MLLLPDVLVALTQDVLSACYVTTTFRHAKLSIKLSALEGRLSDAL